MVGKNTSIPIQVQMHVGVLNSSYKFSLYGNLQKSLVHFNSTPDPVVAVGLATGVSYFKYPNRVKTDNTFLVKNAYYKKSLVCFNENLKCR